MKQTMRWFGPSDPVTLRDIRQSGASGIVTALHHVPNGAVWQVADIAARKREIVDAGLEWTVVESVPVHEGIKTRSPQWAELVDAYRQTLRHLAECGIKVVTYNFMPLLDWTRTDLAWELPDGARALRFELVAVAAFDVHILRRPGAERDYDDAILAAAERRFHAMSEVARHCLERTIIAGLPGSEESFTTRDFLTSLETYAAIDAEQLRANHCAFLEAICPVADEVGIRMVVHPDDPPFPMFGIPRVVSTTDDLDALFAAVPAWSNGLCFCAASFSLRPEIDVAGMIPRYGDRIGFLHLRSISKEPDGAFHEAAHLEGDSRLAEVVTQIHLLQQRTGRSIPMRPDHGHQMLYDLDRKTNPGYSLLGRMRGLAELRGLELGAATAFASVQS